MKDDETKYSVEEVVLFCHTCEIRIVERAKTWGFLHDTGKYPEDIINEIRQLRVENSCADPELDYGRNRKGYVYQFKKLVFGKYWCYIKVKIKIDNFKIVAVLSFHEEDTNYGIH